MVAIVLVTNARFHHESKSSRALVAHGLLVLVLVDPSARSYNHLLVLQILNNLTTNLGRLADVLLAICIGYVRSAAKRFVAAWIVST